MLISGGGPRLPESGSRSTVSCTGTARCRGPPKLRLRCVRRRRTILTKKAATAATTAMPSTEKRGAATPSECSSDEDCAPSICSFRPLANCPPVSEASADWPSTAPCDTAGGGVCWVIGARLPSPTAPGDSALGGSAISVPSHVEMAVDSVEAGERCCHGAGGGDPVQHMPQQYVPSFVASLQLDSTAHEQSHVAGVAGFCVGSGVGVGAGVTPLGTIGGRWAPSVSVQQSEQGQRRTPRLSQVSLP